MCRHMHSSAGFVLLEPVGHLLRKAEEEVQPGMKVWDPTKSPVCDSLTTCLHPL